MHHPTATADLAHARRADLHRHTRAHALRMATRRDRAPASSALGRLAARLTTRRASSSRSATQVGARVEPACPAC